jgi:hypothetical protein
VLHALRLAVILCESIAGMSGWGIYLTWGLLIIIIWGLGQQEKDLKSLHEEIAELRSELLGRPDEDDS